MFIFKGYTSTLLQNANRELHLLSALLPNHRYLKHGRHILPSQSYTRYEIWPYLSFSTNHAHKSNASRHITEI